MITKFGKRFLTNYLAGNVSFTTKELAFGIGNSTPDSNGNDTRLNFEFYRVPVSLSTIEISEVSGNFVYKAVFIATLPQDVAGVISEIALYPSSRTSINNFDSKFLADFADRLDWRISSGGNPEYDVTAGSCLLYTSPSPRD